MQRLSLFLGAAAAILSTASAQTWTLCNPLNTTCPDNPALGISHNFVFNTSTSVTNTFNITAGTLNYGTDGTEFTVAKRGDSPTIQSQFYIFFGSVSVVMKAASGQGIISSIVLESDDLDEVDWEFMGGNGTHAETNYFGKGNTTSFDRAAYFPVTSDVRENFHNYTVHWTSDKLEWYIDSQLVRTLPYAAANGGNNYPQTPMTVRLGIWAGGDPSNSNGTIEWAGGLTDFSQGPYTMVVQSAQINDYGTGSAYQYSDHTGSWQSIKAIAGNSTVAKAIYKEENPPPSLAQKWASMSSTTKLAIYCGAGGGAALIFSVMLFTCIRQRRAGRRERDAYNAKIEKEREEAYREQMELREKGLGGWDEGAYSSQGEDALGGWGGSHVPAGVKASDFDEKPMPKASTNVIVNEVPSRNATPTLPDLSGPIKRNQSPGIASPQPLSPANSRWAGGNPGGMIQSAGNAYSGAYRGDTSMSSRSYSASNNIPRSPGFPVSPSQVQPSRGYGGGAYGQSNNGGYSRF